MRDSAEDRLGRLRSVRRPTRQSVVLPLVFASCLLVLTSALGATADGLRGFLLSLPFGLACFALLAIHAMRQRDLRIEVHDSGLVVHRGRARDVIVFEDVDELWFELERRYLPAGELALIRAVRLVEHGGAKHTVPLYVELGYEITRHIVRHCSLPLAADAEKALRAGETLTFGKVRLDAQGIILGQSRAAWKDLRLVRMQPSRIVFFRGQTVIPWRTVSVDKVPHPTVFMNLVRACAPRIEVDDPLASQME
ncbi:DUF6585 family protein [Polyangium jinanense]|uniref:Uncharacterized protein n=1 Tax=Polyangium jinanense TaxID=2829994 RepID=A0A9X4AXB7_9BACT|nr:DUF6585 family protein [Polyangium jinanense]MDC3959494.1 hypothetical protein [Polyangium jinanense]MDC3986092.1 hypothetical protein [Polyangium jinanense]